jgi:hypothetical protein
VNEEFTPNLENRRYEDSPPQSPSSRALNHDGIKREKNWQVLRITAGQFHVFLKMLQVIDPPRGRLAGTAEDCEEMTTSTAAAFIANS